MSNAFFSFLFLRRKTCTQSYVECCCHLTRVYKLPTNMLSLKCKTLTLGPSSVACQVVSSSPVTTPCLHTLMQLPCADLKDGKGTRSLEFDCGKKLSELQYEIQVWRRRDPQSSNQVLKVSVFLLVTWSVHEEWRGADCKVQGRRQLALGSSVGIVDGLQRDFHSPQRCVTCHCARATTWTGTPLLVKLVSFSLIPSLLKIHYTQLYFSKQVLRFSEAFFTREHPKSDCLKCFDPK